MGAVASFNEQAQPKTFTPAVRMHKIFSFLKVAGGEEIIVRREDAAHSNGDK